MMFKFGRMVTVAGFAILLAVTSARAATPEEAKALGEKAAALIISQGEKAFATISDPNGEFVQGELYVTVVDKQGIVRAHLNPKLIGVNMWESTDPDGVKFTQDAVKIGSSAGSGWLSYKFTNPASKKIEPKKVWVTKAGEFVTLCGVYVTQ